MTILGSTRRRLGAVVLVALLVAVAAALATPARPVHADNITCTWGWPTVHCTVTQGDPDPAPKGAPAPAPRRPGLLHRLLHPGAAAPLGPGLAPPPVVAPAPDMAPAAAPQSLSPTTPSRPGITHRAAALDHPYGMLELVLRPALVDLAGPQEGFSISLYIKALGHDPETARSHWAEALTDVTALLRSKAFALP